MTKRLITYYRVSTDKNAEKQSPESQKVACRKFAEEKDFYIVKEFIETKSAFKERPVFLEMIEYIKDNKDIDGILVFRFDRLIRDPDEFSIVYNNFTLRNKEIWEVTGIIDLKDPASKLMTRIKVDFSEYEVNLISERTKAGIEAARARGQQIGRPKKPFNIKKLKEFLIGEKGKERLTHSKKTVASIFGMTVRTFNERLKENEYGYLIGEEPKHLQNSKNRSKTNETL